MNGLPEVLDKYCFENGIGQLNQYTEDPLPHFEFSEMEVLAEVKKGTVLGSRKGGLIKGHYINKNYGVFLLLPVKDNAYRYAGEVFPGSYITGIGSFKEYKSEFEYLENELSLSNIQNYGLETFKIPDKCRIIDTLDKKVSFILLDVYSQFIFSKITVVNHLNRIVEIENQY